MQAYFPAPYRARVFDTLKATLDPSATTPAANIIVAIVANRKVQNQTSSSFLLQMALACSRERVPI